jgi:hypothetical protein
MLRKMIMMVMKMNLDFMMIMIMKIYLDFYSDQTSKQQIFDL